MLTVDEKEKKKLFDIFQQLPVQSRHEILDFADYLAHRHRGSSEFPHTTLDEVAGCLNYTGPAKSKEEMDNAISARVKEKWTKQ